MKISVQSLYGLEVKSVNGTQIKSEGAWFKPKGIEAYLFSLISFDHENQRPIALWSWDQKHEWDADKIWKGMIC